MKDFDKHIPSYELLHENNEVSFAIRSTQDVMAMFGETVDVPHRHNYYTIIWSHNPSGKHIVDYKEFEMQPNDVFFVSPEQVHQVLHNKTPQGTVILFTCDFLSRNYVNPIFISNLNLFSDVSTSPPIKLGDESVPVLLDLVSKMKEVFSKDETFKFELLGAYLKVFLIECNKYALPPLSNLDQTVQSAMVIIKNFKALLEIHFKSWHKVSNYAQELNISSDYLNNVIKSAVGKTAKDLIQQRIILEAKRLGLHTDYTTKEIAYQIGFRDPSHFSRFFKKEENIPFTDFRAQLNAKLNPV